MRTLWVMALMLIGLNAGLGQDPQRSPDPSASSTDSLFRRNTALVFFERNLNTYNWVGRIMVDTSIAGNRTTFVEQYSTNIIHSGADGSGTPLSTGQQQANLLLSRPLIPDVTVLGNWSSMVYSDNRGLGLGNASSHTILGGLSLDPFPILLVQPMAGFRWDRQSDFNDRGPAYSLGASLHNLDIDGYALAGSGQYRLDQLNPRRLESHFLRTSVQKEFSPGTLDTLEAGFMRSRREIYLQPANGIESRLDDIVTFSNLLRYRVDREIWVDLFVSMYDRSLEKSARGSAIDSTGIPQFDTRIDEFRLDSYVQVDFRSVSRRVSSTLRLGHSERNETHQDIAPPTMSSGMQILFAERNKQEQSKDNLARRTFLTGAVNFAATPFDRFSLDGSVSILRYDTPSLLNLEDRDELLTALTLTSFHHVNRTLDVGVVLDGTLSHLVYLLPERSANNNINRILRLSPRTVWSPGSWLTTVNAFEVLANYTVYDFEDRLASARSFSYRQWGWMDSTRVDMSDRVGLDIFAYLKFYERGELRWHEFTERLENSFADRTYAAQVRFNPSPEAFFTVGVRYFSQTRYAYLEGAEVLDQFVRSVGPTFTILWKPGPFSLISLRGWYESRTQPDGSHTPLTTMSLHLTLNF